MSRASRRVALCAGTSWYVWNFRRNVIGYFTERGWDVSVIAPEDEWSARLNDLPGVRYVGWPVSLDGAGPIAEAGSLRRLARILAGEAPDFVLNHGIKANVYGGLACRWKKIPYANVVTGLGMRMRQPGPFAWALARLYAYACSGGVALIVQNPADHEFMRQHGLSARIPVHRTMGSGVDLSHFSMAPFDPAARPEFLFVGRLQADKGVHDFVEAARRVHVQFPEARFTILGDRTHANRGAVSEAELEDWRREPFFDFAGHQDDVRPWLARATTLVMPSHGGEGMPKVVLEAAASGRPAIVSDVPGCRDAVIDGETGWICPPGDPEALAARMRGVLALAPDELQSVGTAARAQAEAAFSDVVVARMAFELAESAAVRRPT